MKGKHIAIIVILILVVVGIIYRKKIMSFFTGSSSSSSTTTNSSIPEVKSYGAELTQADIDCGNSGTVGRIIENCTKPKYKAVGSAKQKSFRFCPEADCDLNLDACVDTIKTPDGKIWYFNYQSGDKCIYIDDTSYSF